MMSVVDDVHTSVNRDTFRRDAQEWLRDNVSREWREGRGGLSEEDETRLRREWDQRLFEGGYAGLSLPRAYGGQGLGLEEEVIFHQLAAQEQAPDGLARIGKILTAPTLITLGTERQRAAYLPRIFSGEDVWCQGFSEPGAGSDLASVKCTARRTEGGWLVRGTKIWTSFAKHADRCLMLAQTDPDAPRYKNLTLFLLDMKQDAVRVEPIKQISGSEHFAETHYDDAFVSDDDVVGAAGDGWRVAMTVLANERGIVEAITRYVEIRADIDVLESCCVRDDAHALNAVSGLDARTEVLRWQVAKAVAAQDADAQARTSMVLKVWWSELWQEVTTFASTVECATHREHWRHQYLESRAATIFSGTSEIQRNIIAERVLRMPK